MRILVFGGWGQLGTDLAAAAEGRHEALRPTHRQVDVTNASEVLETAMRLRPHAIIDAAAFHNVEVCEGDAETAFAVNAVGGLNVARAARASGARCVYISTDYVFNGSVAGGYTEEMTPGPINVYGCSKFAGEQLVRSACPDSIIVRGSGMFGHAGSAGKGGNFVETMLRKADQGEALSVVDDQIFAPTATHDLAERLLLLLDRAAPPGVYHGANGGSCSWYTFAVKIFELSEAKADLSPRSSGVQSVARPAVSVLIDTMSARLGLPPMRPWEEALASYLEERAENSAARRSA